MSDYKAPKTGLLSLLPSSWVPYAELCRLAKPTGVVNISFPYIFGCLYAAWVMRSPLQSLVFRISILLFSGFLLRCAGCSWNDIIDRDVDKLVQRCRLRPMARGALTVRDALVFTIAQFAAWLAVLSILVPAHWSYTIPLIGLVLFYPFAKRYTHHAQVVLGFTLAWGVIIGSRASGMDLFASAVRHGGGDYPWGLAGLFLSYVMWSVVHDSIYAQQDAKDDAKANVKSMAVGYGGSLRAMLAAAGAAQVLLHVYAGVALRASWLYHVPASVGPAVLLAAMISTVDLESADDCGWWFNQGSVMFGSMSFLGLFAEYLTRI